MKLSTRTTPFRWLILSLMILGVAACNAATAAPATQIVPVTQVVPVTQIVETTRLIDVTRVVPVTRIAPATPVEVTRIILAAPIVEVTRLVIIEASPPVPPPAVTAAPTMPPAPTAHPAPAIPVPKPTNAPLPANESILVWYDFEDDFLSSRIVADQSGNGYHAQVVGPVSRSEGIAGGQAILLDGHGYIEAQINPAAGRNTVSFAMWFKTDHPEYNYKLASAAWWNGGPGSGWTLATHIPEFWSDDTNSLFLPDLVNLDNAFSSGEWNHEVVTYDGLSLREYTNGQLVNDWLTTGAAIGQGLPMAVGAWPSTGFYFQGSIDEFRIFSWALSPEEVLDIYNREQ